MDLKEIIIELLGIQNVEIENINLHRTSRKVRVIARRKKSAWQFQWRMEKRFGLFPQFRCSIFGS